jgi:hypothetical protein
MPLDVKVEVLLPESKPFAYELVEMPTSTDATRPSSQPAERRDQPSDASDHLAS